MELETRLILEGPPTAHLSAIENARYWRKANMDDARRLRADGNHFCAAAAVGHARAWHREIMAMLPAPSAEQF